ncbi:CspA family cold shock protein [Rhodovulum iodosum]|uniref:CspA family cold shock protein n=1 Tax=Rhodovulum iodosum TaxID=68291 RepID=A0ABV3XN43_9RHOB|nr:cold shock domain-containing protein [Rhodovulum robiginosum]RSK35871.1 cold shock domain-containing protein [Rhodovulum robiginosum]
MGESEENSGRRVRGRVKWFDPGKGFGFVIADEGGPDILLHANVLRNYGQSSVAEGAGIEVEVQTTSRGQQAVHVLSIEPPETGDGPPLEDLFDTDPAELEAQPLEPARVKWFDKSKGFGFANVFGRPEDVFIHVEVLRRSGLSDLQPGEAICLRAVEGRRGRMAAMVCSWESALPPSDGGR